MASYFSENPITLSAEDTNRFRQSFSRLPALCNIFREAYSVCRNIQ